MNIDNHLDLGQTTGSNGASMNTGSGTIDSGSTNASITITNSGNTISINGSAEADTNGDSSNTTTTLSGNTNGTVSVSNDGNTQKVKATLGPNGELNIDSSSDQNSSRALVLSAATGNLDNNGAARDPFTVTQGDSLSVFFVKYILPLLLIGLVLAAVVWGYVRKNTNPQSMGR
jgi:hypothetical protein